jgi:hypothetical protein
MAAQAVQLDRGEAFYALVKRRTGQTREQAERHFLPDNANYPLTK